MHCSNVSNRSKLCRLILAFLLSMVFCAPAISKDMSSSENNVVAERVETAESLSVEERFGIEVVALRVSADPFSSADTAPCRH